jgi:CubicO group peptidase (beta-lactamase class C family)
MTYGFLVGEVIRRVTGQFPGPWIASHLTGPLHAPCHLGLPQALRGSVAPVLPFPLRPEGSASTLRLDPDSLPYRAAFGCTEPPLSPLAVNDPDVQAAQLPAANGIGSARGLARIFAALISKVDGTRLVSQAAMEAARREHVRGPDLAAAAIPESALGLGFSLPTRERPLGGPGSFGTVGLGGCRAWALPEAALAYAYLPTQLLDANPDPRDLALTAAVLAAARQAPGTPTARARPRTGRKPEPAASYESFTSDLRLPGDTTVGGGQEKKPGSRGDVR